MDDEDFAELFRPRRSDREASWDDVAREFQNLGKTVGQVVRSAWERPPNDRVRDWQDALQSLLDEMSRAVDDGVSTPEAEKVRGQVTRLADSIRQAAEKSSAELRPELVKLLRQADEELRRFTDPPPDDRT